ncbi:uncharacterized protein G2W53_039424 [Senna tora]|uniref:Uncharacterized protein n=1 Tax=Senna tora TaxID=362788 RepID=A0A834SMN3_9FABA|nr:uncharacterized protein G2W53_039424 [Senna tora]
MGGGGVTGFGKDGWLWDGRRLGFGLREREKGWFWWGYGREMVHGGWGHSFGKGRGAHGLKGGGGGVVEEIGARAETEEGEGFTAAGDVVVALKAWLWRCGYGGGDSPAGSG